MSRDRSPLLSIYRGQRSCVSPTRNATSFFVEREGRHTDEIYVQGLSTSLPEDVQREFGSFNQGIGKCSNDAETGYAIEYDMVMPHQLRATFGNQKDFRAVLQQDKQTEHQATKKAAGQGIIAGINAALKVQDKPELILKRSDGYIGVMIDDLVTKGTVRALSSLDQSG